MPSPYLVELFAPVYKLSLWFTCAVSVNVWSWSSLPFPPCLLVDVILLFSQCSVIINDALIYIMSTLCYNERIYVRLVMSEFWLIQHNGLSQVFRKLTDVIGYTAQSYKKHVVNGNLWHILEHRLKDVLEPLPNLFRQYPIIAVFTDGAIDCVRKWTCDVRAWEQSQLRELATLPIYTVIPSKVYNSVGGVLPHFIGRHSSRNSGNQRERKRGMGRQHDQVPSKV